MIDGKYDVIFRGQIVRGYELSDVQNNLVKLFKSSPQAVSRLFGENEVVIRKGLDYAAAMKYQSALKGAGALALIKEDQSSPQEVQSQQTDNGNQSQGKANFNQTTQAASSDNSSGEPAISETENLTEGALSVAAPGARILPDKIYEKREVDTSDLSLANVGERLLPEKEPINYPKPSIDHLSLEDQ